MLAGLLNTHLQWETKLWRVADIENVVGFGERLSYAAIN